MAPPMPYTATRDPIIYYVGSREARCITCTNITMQSLRRNRQTRERVQASSNHPVGGRDAPPLAITYRTNQRVPAQVYVSLAQLTAMAQGLQARRQDAPHRLPELNEELDVRLMNLQ